MREQATSAAGAGQSTDDNPAGANPEALAWPTELTALQQPQWPDAVALAQARRVLGTVPPLVTPDECDTLREQLASAARGEAFVLMGGDCAETFADNTVESIQARLRTLLQMAAVLTYGASLPVIKVGRMAGQYGKPRSSDSETRDGVSLPSYRGDAVNALEFTPEARTPDPQRLVAAYRASSAALNQIRSFTQSGYADLRQVHAWNQDFVSGTPAGKQYEDAAKEISRALAFMNACGADPEEFRQVDFFVSHEALLLDYEYPLTRRDPRTKLPYSLSAHFLWVGERTRQPDSAHAHLLKTIRNPIGVKVGPTATTDDVVELVRLFNPDAIAGRLTLITRMGAGVIRKKLPAIVEAVSETGIPVVWVCDPMHGNTRTASTGHKTRSFDDVLEEVRGFFEVHQSLGTHAGGVHFELTGDAVTECIGGGDPIGEADLADRYETACDPRLNRLQSLELSFLLAETLAANNSF